MAPIRADYRVIADDWVIDDGDNAISFDLPDSAHPEQRSILSFMFRAEARDGFQMSLELNGIRVWTFSSGSEDVDVGPLCMQEVIGRDIIRSGRNTFRFTTTGGYRFSKLSDIVLWYQATS